MKTYLNSIKKLILAVLLLAPFWSSGQCVKQIISINDTVYDGAKVYVFPQGSKLKMVLSVTGCVEQWLGLRNLSENKKWDSVRVSTITANGLNPIYLNTGFAFIGDITTGVFSNLPFQFKMIGVVTGINDNPIDISLNTDHRYFDFNGVEHGTDFAALVPGAYIDVTDRERKKIVKQEN